MIDVVALAKRDAHLLCQLEQRYCNGYVRFVVRQDSGPTTYSAHVRTRDWKAPVGIVAVVEYLERHWGPDTAAEAAKQDRAEAYARGYEYGRVLRDIGVPQEQAAAFLEEADASELRRVAACVRKPYAIEQIIGMTLDELRAVASRLSPSDIGAVEAGAAEVAFKPDGSVWLLFNGGKSPPIIGYRDGKRQKWPIYAWPPPRCIGGPCPVGGTCPPDHELQPYGGGYACVER